MRRRLAGVVVLSTVLLAILPSTAQAARFRWDEERALRVRAWPYETGGNCTDNGDGTETCPLGLHFFDKNIGATALSGTCKVTIGIYWSGGGHEGSVTVKHRFPFDVDAGASQDQTWEFTYTLPIDSGAGYGGTTKVVWCESNGERIRS